MIRKSAVPFRNCFAVLGFLLVFVTFTPVVKILASAMQQDWDGEKGEVLVVLGGSMLVPGTDSHSVMGDDTYLRCVYASWILQTERFHYVVVSGGQGLAEAMATFLERRGVAPASILRENASMSTYQNALFTKRILEAQYGSGGSPEVVLLTSDYHSWRARRTFEHCGLQAKMIPIPDVIKRCSFPSYRWTGALTLLDELCKSGAYLATGRI